MTRSHLLLASTGWLAFAIAMGQAHEPDAIAGDAGTTGPAEPTGAGPGCPADFAPAGGDGVVDVVDLLALLAQWGACPTCTDAAEPNDVCTSTHALATVESSGANQTLEWAGSTLLAGDIDLFVFDADETDGTCSCCDAPFCMDEDYLVTVTLAVPGTATGSLVFRVGTSCTTNTAGAVAVAPGATGSISFWVDGACGSVDTYTRHILVAGANATVSSCDAYTLTYSFVPGCQ